MQPRLTPYLRRRILALSVADRVALMADIGGSIFVRNQREGRLAELRDAMLAITGIDVRDPRRFADHVRARSVFCFVARMEGFGLQAIGDELGMDHSSAHYLAKRMTDALERPSLWSDYINLYNQFTNQTLKTI